MVEAETEAAQGKINEVKTGLDNIDGSTATGTADVNGQPAQEELTSASANLARYGTQIGTATADANSQPAKTAISSATTFLGAYASLTGTARVDGNNLPAKASIDGAFYALRDWGRAQAAAQARADIADVLSKVPQARAALRSLDGYVAQTYVKTIYTTIRREVAVHLDSTADRNPIYGATGGFVSGDRIRKFGVGGLVTGPGSGTSDSILAWLSNGEAVTRARAVDYWGLAMMRAINGSDITGVRAALAAKGLAAGGVAGSPTAYTSNQYLTTQSAAAPSLAGLSIVGTLDTPFGPAQIRGVVRDEMRTAGRASARTVTQGGR